MQLGDSIYLDLEIKGSDKKDFLTYSDALDFQIIETAGTSLPLVYVKFISRDPEITNLFQETNKVKVKLGSSKDNADTFNVSIMKPNVNNDPSGTHQVVEFIGFIGNLSYMVDRVSKVYEGKSLKVAKEIIKEYFGYTIPSHSVNKEYPTKWRQNNQTTCAFLADVLLHADLRPSFPLFSFNKYGEFNIVDLDTKIKEGPKYNFVPSTPKNIKDIRYFNNFNVESFSTMYNAYSGFNKVTEIYGVNDGNIQQISNKNTPILGSSIESEMLQAGNTNQMNVIQTSNVHKTYYEAFAYNTDKLMSLSAMMGVAQLIGRYYRNLQPLDLINVKAGMSSSDTAYDGLYLIDTIVTKADFASGSIHTYVYLTRDNKNNVEDYVAEKKNVLQIATTLMNKLASTIAELKSAYAMCLKIIDGTYMEQLLSFAIATKNNILRSVSVAGITLDFTSQANLLSTLVRTGNALMNTLLDMIFPAKIAATLRDFIIDKPSAKALLSKYISDYVPVEIRDLIIFLTDTLFDTTDTLNSIAKDNNVPVTTSEGTPVAETSTTSEQQQKANTIISNFGKNTDGVVIPFPIIDITESESLLSEEKLQDYLANETISNLTDLGYMEDIDPNDFKDILLGKKKIDFITINLINRNAGNEYFYRYWGTYNSMIDLTSFNIKKSFKDKYRTIPCTKVISATKNAKIFFACPVKEEVKIYINSKRVDLKSFETDLGYTDTYGAVLKYNVYYTEEGYNSNSVLFEVKSGGMV